MTIGSFHAAEREKACRWIGVEVDRLERREALLAQREEQAERDLAITEAQVVSMRQMNAFRAGRTWVMDEQTRQLRAELALSEARLAREFSDL